MVKGQLSIVNCPLGTCDAFTKATGRLKELSIKKKLCLSGGQAGLCVFILSN